jgi:iron complex transport system substrate-binding protein
MLTVTAKSEFVRVSTWGRFGVLVLLLASCAMGLCGPLPAQTAATPSPAGPLYKEVVDELGRSIRIPQPVQRIVSLAPSLTETLYALGLQDRLVGDTDYCDYPEDAQKKTKVGGGINPNIEQIMALRPDLVLVTKAFNRLETVHALADLGVPSYATDPHTVQQIISSTERLAEVLGAADAGVSLGTDLDRRLDELQQKLAAYPARRVFFIVWNEPLISVGQNTFIADALRHAGAVSIVESSQDWPQMSLEEVVHLQPEFLIFAPSHSDNSQSDFEDLAERPGWRGLDAVRNHHVAIISDAVNRSSPRIVSAIEDLAHQLHPEAFAPHTPDENDKKNAPPPPRGFAPSTDFNADAAVAVGDCACAH